MKEKKYWILIIFLLVLSVCGIYNFLNPIKNIKSDEKEILEGKILTITKEYEYNESSEYVEKCVVEILNKENNEQFSIKLNNEDISKYKEDEIVNFYEDKGEYYITDELPTRHNGGIGWILLSVCEIIVAIYIFIKNNRINK